MLGGVLICDGIESASCARAFVVAFIALLVSIAIIALIKLARSLELHPKQLLQDREALYIIIPLTSVVVIVIITHSFSPLLSELFIFFAGPFIFMFALSGNRNAITEFEKKSPDELNTLYRSLPYSIVKLTALVVVALSVFFWPYIFDSTVGRSLKFLADFDLFAYILSLRVTSGAKHFVPLIVAAFALGQIIFTLRVRKIIRSVLDRKNPPQT